MTWYLIWYRIQYLIKIYFQKEKYIQWEKGEIISFKFLFLKYLFNFTNTKKWNIIIKKGYFSQWLKKSRCAFISLLFSFMFWKTSFNNNLNHLIDDVGSYDTLSIFSFPTLKKRLWLESVTHIVAIKWIMVATQIVFFFLFVGYSFTINTESVAFFINNLQKSILLIRKIIN